MKSKVELYDEKFFNEINDGSIKSAAEIVPYVINLTQPKSVLDVGCAQGAWLSIFREHGVTDYFGIDGDYVDQAKLIIEPEKFQAADLQERFDLRRRFDLAICLEVAEHLPEPSGAIIVECLVNHASCVLFSASIPYQDGTDHINEQWPNYWKSLFRARGYKSIDIIRPRFWLNHKVSWWFSQNIILYYDPNFHDFDNLVPEIGSLYDKALPIVHPELLEHKERRISELSNDLNHYKLQHSSAKHLLRRLAKVILKIS